MSVAAGGPFQLATATAAAGGGGSGSGRDKWPASGPPHGPVVEHEE